MAREDSWRCWGYRIPVMTIVLRPILLSIVVTRKLPENTPNWIVNNKLIVCDNDKF